MTVKNISIIGAGAWGTALAIVAANNGHRVSLLARDKNQVQHINNTKFNEHYLPGVKLNQQITASVSANTIRQADYILISTPTQHIRTTLTGIKNHWPHGAPAVICAKGIEQTTGQRPSQITQDVLDDVPIAILSGPSFAIEVAKGQPTAITLASSNQNISGHLTQLLGNSHFRIYQSNDVTGAEIGGAVKNVIAIACGITHGRKLGDNARAALITRGLAEISRLAESLGGRAETLRGLSGLGDLLLTCTAIQSRNFSLGVELGQGQNLNDILGRRITVAEGVYTAQSVTNLAASQNIEMPICQAVRDILYQHADIGDTIEHLLSRPQRLETE